MNSCFDAILSCLKPSSSRHIYQNASEVPPERGIEYDRLIEVTEHSPNFGRPSQIINARERHLISNKLYSEYAEDQERRDREKERELLEEEQRLADQEEEYYRIKRNEMKHYYGTRTVSATTNEEQDLTDNTEDRFLSSPPLCQAKFIYQTSFDSCVSDDLSVPNAISSSSASSQTPTSPNPPQALIDHQTDRSRVNEHHVTENHVTLLSAEQSDKLLEDIDILLEDRDSDDESGGRQDPSNSTKNFVPHPHPPNPTVYRLTNVSPHSEEGYVSVTSPGNHPPQNPVFDPFEAFERRVSAADDISESSHESFVITQ